MDTQEKRIIRHLINGLLERGYEVAIYDEEARASKWLSGNAATELMAAVGHTDTTIIETRKANAPSGSVLCVHGKGQDILSDWSTSLDSIVDETLRVYSITF